jgi:predicted RNA-binding Zn-ribbon protein involved in translation (DUF1610 family)
MKNTKACPKCGSNTLVVVPGRAEAYGVGENIPIGWTIFSSVKVTRYMCYDCGFIEEWVDEADDREKIRTKYGAH